MVAAAMSTGIQSTFLLGNSGSAFMDGWKEVANMMGHISSVDQCPVCVWPESWPTRRRAMGRERREEAVWVMRSTGLLVSFKLREQIALKKRRI